MSRHLKFRAWYKIGKKMMYEGVFIGLDGDISFNAKLMPKNYNPFEFEIMQYTGLRDKNGKDIWEGDILSVPAEGTWPEYKYIVDFWHGSFVAKETGSSGLNNYPNNFNFRVSEVIGNIYEHSHLLKGESNEAK